MFRLMCVYLHEKFNTKVEALPRLVVVPTAQWFVSSQARGCPALLSMVVVEQCCCCSVRTGSLVVGVVTLLGALLQLGNDVKELIRRAVTNIHQREEAVDIFYNENRETIDVERDEIRSFFNLSFYIAAPDLVLCLGMILVICSLIHGVHSKNKTYLLPAIILVPLDLLLRVTVLFVLCYSLGIGHSISTILCLIFLYGVIIDTCLWLCVFSHWQQLKLQSKDSEHQKYHQSKHEEQQHLQQQDQYQQNKLHHHHHHQQQQHHHHHQPYHRAANKV